MELTKQHKIFFGLIVLRFLTEGLNTFNVFNKANFVASGILLLLIYFYFLPDILLKHFKYEKYFSVNLFKYIFLYLFYLALRVSLRDLISFKYLLSETIVYFFFIYAYEQARLSAEFASTTKRIVILLFQAIIVLGLFQIIQCIFVYRSLMSVYLIRPVKSIFLHQNIYAALVLPISLYFYFSGAKLWSGLALFSCLGTGTRSPFLIFFLAMPLILVIKFRKRVNVIALILSLLLISSTYFYLVQHYSSREINYNLDERMSASSFIWRTQVWSKLYEDYVRKGELFLGYSVGASHRYIGSYMGRDDFPPHNDYLKLLFDTGIFGLVLYLLVIYQFFKHYVRLNEYKTILCYMMIVAFQFPDNYIYFTHALFTYILIAVELAERKRLIENTAS